MDNCTIFASFAANDAIHAYDSMEKQEMQAGIQKKCNKKVRPRSGLF